MPLAAEDFSYAAPTDPWFKRKVIHGVEWLTGAPYICALYEDFLRYPPQDQTVWEAVARRLEIDLRWDAEKLAAWPKTGPLVVVCNHPYGVLDGLAACYLVAKVRPDFQVLANSVLMRAEEIRPSLLPIDFDETKQAQQTNIKSRAEAKALLEAGGCLLIFPSGAVSTTPSWHKRRAVDPEWKTYAARMVVQTKAPVAPMFFAGQNGALFQLASHVSQTLRLALLIYELHNKIGAVVPVGLGDVVPWEKVAAIKDRHAQTQFLRDITYALDAITEPPSRPGFRRRRSAPPPGVRPGTARP